MARAMTTREFDRWIRDLSAFGTKWGCVPEHKKISKYLRDQHKKRLRAHVDPLGRPWRPRFHKPMPKVGDVAPMLAEGGARRVVTARIRNVPDRRRAVEFRKRFGPPAKAVPALIRTRKYPGAHKAKKILEFLTKAGRSVRLGKTFLTYGYTPGTRWIEEAIGGGTSRRYRKRIPERDVIGMNDRDVEAVTKIYADGLEKRAVKRRVR